MEREINLDSEQYGEFLRCLSILRENCNDVDIREGIVRQRSNDNGSIFEIDLAPLIQDISLPLSNLSEKLELLKMFSGNEIQIGIDSRAITINDQYSSLRLECPLLDFLDNKFMSETELESVFLLEEENLIVEYEFPTVITDRVGIVSKVFNVITVQVNFEGEKVSLSTQNQSKDQYARFVDNIPSNVVIEGGKSNLTITPFIIDHDSDILFKMYGTSQEGIFINKFTTDVGDVNIAIYTRSSLVQEEE